MSLRIRPITFNGDVGTEFISFLGDLAQHSRLQELELAFSATNKTSLANVFDTVSRFGLLKCCKLEYVPTQHVDWDEPVPAEIMEPLYRIRGMSELDLAMLPMVVTPDAVSKIAASWPGICVLYLGEDSPKSIASLELQDLAPLATLSHPYHLGFKIRSTARRGFVGNGNKIPVEVYMGCSSLTLAHAAPMAEVFVELFPAGELYAGADDAENGERRRVVEEINRCIASHKPETKE